MFELSYCRLIVLFKQLFSHFNTITLNIIICNHNVTIKRYYNLISYFFNFLLATISSLQAPQAQIFAEINNIFSCKIEWSMHYRACRCSTNAALALSLYTIYYCQWYSHILNSLKLNLLSFTLQYVVEWVEAQSAIQVQLRCLELQIISMHSYYNLPWHSGHLLFF